MIRNTALAVQVIDDLERVMDELKNIPSYTVPADAPLEVLEAEMDRIVEIYEVIKFLQSGLRDGSIIIGGSGVPRDDDKLDRSKHFVI